MTDSSILKTVLKDIPILRGLDDAGRTKIGEIVEIRPVERGTVLFEAGQKRKEFFLVLDGSVHLYRMFNDEVQTLALLDKYDFVVESALVNPEMEHNHTAESTKQGSILVISGKAFREFAEREPGIANTIYGNIIENLAERLHHANNKLVTLYATGKIASSYGDIENLIDLLLKTIMLTIRAKKAVFAWFRPLENRIVIEESIGYANDQKIENLKLSLNDDPLLGEIYRTQRDIYVTKALYAEKPHLKTDYSCPTMLGVKIRTGDKVAGAILLGEKEGNRDFSYNNQILLHVIVRQIALAVQDAEVRRDQSQNEEHSRVYISPM